MSNSNRNIWVDYLRSGITVLVVAHHSSLAYTTFARFDAVAYIRSTNPVVDAKRWIGLDIFENYNDVFFMSLMFLIGGLFLTGSIKKKGVISFITDRFKRLFLPFLILGTMFMLIAYFPSYYLAHGNTDILFYIKDFFTIEKWPVGPPWFLWMLFLFNLIFALFHSVFKKTGARVQKAVCLSGNHPVLLLLVLSVITWILHTPVAYLVGQGTWTGIGPFDFQLSRILLYFGYFSLGILIGSTDFSNGIFSRESSVVRNWKLWIIASIGIYALLTVIQRPLVKMVTAHQMRESFAWMIYYTIFAVSCASSSLAFLTGFRKSVTTGSRWMNSLSENAYMIYLIHYIFITWMQFLMLKLDLPATLKFAFVLISALSLSWITSILLRKLSIFRKYF